jgi:hypothetical protein
VNVAKAMGVRNLDGNGNLTGSFIINAPVVGSATGERTISSGTQQGTYTVNCDGTGQFSRFLKLTDGTTTTTLDDFLITGAVVQNGQLIATTIVDLQETPSALVPGGLFVIRTHTLRPTLPATPAPPSPLQAQTVAIANPKNVTVTSRSIQLDGTQSTSADGKPLTYLWTIPQGSPAAAISGAATATPIVQFAQGRGQYTFQLTVTDSAGKSSTDLATVDYEGN